MGSGAHGDFQYPNGVCSIYIISEVISGFSHYKSNMIVMM